MKLTFLWREDRQQINKVQGGGQMIIKTKQKIKAEKHIGHGVAMRNMGVMECLLEKVKFE